MLKVLIVEDDFRVANVNRQFVERVEGFEVVGKAATVAEAQQQLHEKQPDLVILDVYLPDGSGLKLLRQLRALGHPADIIALTAAKEAETINAVLQGGAFDYIVKPYRFERFAEALRRFRAYRDQMNKAAQAMRGEVDQAEVDRLLHQRHIPRVRKTSKTPALPKGIDELTLAHVRQAVTRHAAPLTAEACGALCRLSRTTARRYLEYMVVGGEVRVEPQYGGVGRPERLYTWIEAASSSGEDDAVVDG